MMDSDPIEFIKGTLRDPAAVGSIIPSSKHLARQYVRDFEFDEETTVIELGPGTGPITQFYYDQMDNPDNYIGIEQDEDYVEVLRKRFPEFTFFAGSAEAMDEYAEEAGLGDSVDMIGSALPFATLPREVQETVFEKIDALLDEPGAEFRAVQLAHAWPVPSAVRFRARVDALLGPWARRDFVLRNIPPAFVMTWRRS